MAIVLGVFGDQARALEVIETLRTARFDTQSVRLVGGSDNVTDFASRAGPSANVAAGPATAVLGGLVEADLPEQALKVIEERVDAGAIVLFADNLESAAATELASKLRGHGAENVSNSDADARPQDG